jgi:hypothetical protein
MSSAIWNTLNHNIASRVRINTTDPLISEPSIFSLVKFLHHQGFDDNVINTTAITELNAKLMAEESRLCAVENSVVAQMQEQLQRLTTMLPATTPLAEIFVARNRAKFSSCRNHTRQAACQAALGALPTPARRSRPTEDAKAVLRQFWDAGTTHPNVEQRIMLACHAHLTFNQVRNPFNRHKQDSPRPSSNRCPTGSRISATAVPWCRVQAARAALQQPRHRASASNRNRRATPNAPPPPPPTHRHRPRPRRHSHFHHRHRHNHCKCRRGRPSRQLLCPATPTTSCSPRFSISIHHRGQRRAQATLRPLPRSIHPPIRRLSFFLVRKRNKASFLKISNHIHINR